MNIPHCPTCNCPEGGPDRPLLHGQLLRVLQLIDAGHTTDQQLAEALTISHNGVKAAVRRMRHKLGARDKAHAVAIGWRTGILGNRP